MGDGDGWTRCEQGHKHWGRFGASGLLPYHRGPDGVVRVLLQKRASWGIGGGTWGMFGGANHSHEDPVAGAIRETGEECTLDTSAVRLVGSRKEDHGAWAFTSVVGSVAEMDHVRPASFETRRAAWVPVDEVEELKLFAPFAGTWPVLRDALFRVVLIVDAANVVGARAEHGWWRDRAGANARLRDDLAVLAEGVSDLPGDLPGEPVPYDTVYPEIVQVVEGAARNVPSSESVRVSSAPGSGDDHIVELVAASAPGTKPLVITADRELRSRVAAAGGAFAGPRWLLGHLAR
ncbi:NUDIX domain-containing protein [Actinomadura gamaensis]|uniref:NUDIX domain-containing protein n=1 Tax=Actinomadura gamaensis TaxID=1763541 RepID=A0ABV9TR55_9ACTN